MSIVAPHFLTRWTRKNQMSDESMSVQVVRVRRVIVTRDLGPEYHPAGPVSSLILLSSLRLRLAFKVLN
jgi:hypothetical protein